MAIELFRQDALDAQRQNLNGEVIAMRVLPLSFTALSALAVALTAVVGLFLFQGEYTRKAYVSGFLAPSAGLIKVYPPQPGLVLEQRVADGRQVREGDTLLVLSTERSSLKDARTQAAVLDQLLRRQDSLRHELNQRQSVDRIQLRVLRGRESSTDAELEQLDAEILLQQRHVDSAKDEVEALWRLLQQQAVSRRQAQQAEALLLDHELKMQRLTRERTRLERERGQLRLDIDAFSLEAETRRAGLERELARLEQERTELEARRHIVITAPRAGTVTTLLAQPGQSVTPNAPLLSILPADSKLEAKLLVKPKAIGFLREGQPVALRYEAFPYRRFGSYDGRIEKIGRTVLLPSEAAAAMPVALTEPVYLVTAALDAETIDIVQQGKAAAVRLQSGMLFDATVRLERRSLLDWLLEPLRGIGGRS